MTNQVCEKMDEKSEDGKKVIGLKKSTRAENSGLT